MELKKYKIEYANGMVQEKYLLPKNFPYFTYKSPLYEAIKTGKLILPEHQGGVHDIKITKLKQTLHHD